MAAFAWLHCRGQRRRQVHRKAQATIEGDTIVVSSDSVAAPVTVRYGWANVPDVNLYNKAGLPASPFQTDGAFTLEPGFELLQSGTNLTGWHYKDGPPFDGKTEASDGRYTARDGRIVVNPGRGLAQLWTTREFPTDFHLKLQFRAGVNADSGVFLRKPQLQCRDYLVAGPYKELKNYKPQDWNEIEVVVRGNVATCTCNGEPLQRMKKSMNCRRPARSGWKPTAARWNIAAFGSRNCGRCDVALDSSVSRAVSQRFPGEIAATFLWDALGRSTASGGDRAPSSDESLRLHASATCRSGRFVGRPASACRAVVEVRLSPRRGRSGRDARIAGPREGPARERNIALRPLASVGLRPISDDDGLTRKYLLALGDGLQVEETVLMRFRGRRDGLS